MKRFLLLALLCASAAFAKSAHQAYAEAASLYIEEQRERALAVVTQGLAEHPNDRKLEMLKELLGEYPDED